MLKDVKQFAMILKPIQINIDNFSEDSLPDIPKILYIPIFYTPIFPFIIRPYFISLIFAQFDKTPVYRSIGLMVQDNALNQNISNARSSPPEVFLNVLKICSKFTGERPCRSVISTKLQSNFLGITLRHGFSPVNLLHFFRTPFP